MTRVKIKRVVKAVVKNKGWRGESWRHSLAAKGIKTKGVKRVGQDVEERSAVIRIPVKEEKKKKGGIRDVAYVPDKP